LIHLNGEPARGKPACTNKKWEIAEFVHLRAYAIRPYEKRDEDASAPTHFAMTQKRIGEIK
jgi:hypothetical protein